MENSNPFLLRVRFPLTCHDENIHASEMPLNVVKKHLLIWHDPNIHSQSNARYIKALQMIYDIQLFTEWKEAITYLKGTPSVSYQVITSENNGELLIKEIMRMDNVTSVYVFCEDSQISLGWIKKFPKVVCTETNFASLLDKLSKDTLRYESTIHYTKTDQAKSIAEAGSLSLNASEPGLNEISGLETRNEQKDNEEHEIMVMAGVNEIAKLFVKETTIIWYDPKGDSPENEKYINDLKAICDVQTFTDWKEAVICLKETQAALCQVILSGVYGANTEMLVNEISSLERLSSIYIFTEDLLEWIDKHKRVVQIKDNFMSITDKIREEIDKWRKKNSSRRTDLPSFAPIFDDMDRSDETHRDIYLRGFTQFKNRKQAKRDFLALAKVLYGTKQDILDLKNFEQMYNEYDMGSLLNWYTKESFFYKLTNNCLRIASPDSIQYCRLALKDLETAIKQKYQQQVNKFSGVYRGAYISDEEWTKLQQNIGKDIEMYGFLSTSTNQDIAMVFCSEDLDKKVFIRIIIPDFEFKDSQGFAEVREFSEIPGEDEILFNIRSRFTILEANIEEIEGSKMRHLILLYGAQPMRVYTKFLGLAREIQLKSHQVSDCKACKQKISFDDDEPIIAIDLCNVNEYTCKNCLKNLKMQESGPFFCISPLAHDLSSSSQWSISCQFKGLWSRVHGQNHLKIPFYGYKCELCTSPRPSNCYTCLDCKSTKTSFCNQCFFSQQINKCSKEGHRIIFERHPFSFWFEDISDKEVQRLWHHNERLLNGFDQTKIYEYTHNYKKQVKYCEAYLEKNGKIDSEGDYEKGYIYCSLALAYSELGEHQKAINYLSTCIEIEKTEFEDKNSRLKFLYNDLGSAYSNLGKYQQAKECFLRALEIGKAEFDGKNPNTVAWYSNLGIVYAKLGEYQKSIELFSQALETQKTVSGDRDPGTAMLYNNLGATYQKMEENEKAIELFSKALEIQKTVFGDKNPDTACSYSNLGAVYIKKGEFKKAIKLISEGLKIFKAVFEDNHHPLIAVSYNNLGRAYQELGEYQNAIKYFSSALEIQKAVFEDNHPDTASTHKHLGVVHSNLGEYQKAIDYYFKALEIHKTVFGDQHPNIGAVYNNLGNTYSDVGEYHKAIDYHSKALEIYKTAFGDKHSVTIGLYNNLGSAYSDLGEYQKAIDYYCKSLEFRIAEFRAKLPFTSTVDSLTDLGSTYSMGKSQTTELLDKVTESRIALIAMFGWKDPETAASYHILGLISKISGENRKTVDYFSRALSIRKEILGENHPETLRSYSSLGLEYDNQREYHKAIVCFSRVLDIKNKMVYKHENMADTCNTIGSLYFRLGEFQKAIYYFFQGLEIQTAGFRHNHSITAGLYNNLGLAYASLGKYRSAIYCFSRGQDSGEYQNQNNSMN